MSNQVKMNRILFIAQHLKRAGTETFMMSVFRGVDHAQFQVDFLLYNWKETDYTQEVEAHGGRIWRVPCRRESATGWYRSLYRFFKEHAREYNAIHYCGNGLTATAPIILSWWFKIPIRISHAHNSSSQGWHNKVLHYLQRGLAKRLTTHHFACSSEAARWFFGSSPAVIIKNGIDTNLFSYNEQRREQTRKKLNIASTTTVIGHVGRFEVEKNHTFMLEVFSDFVAEKPDSLLLLIGKGTLMEQMKEKAVRLAIADKVLFLGERTDVPDLLQAMDLFLMPSIFEGQPFVLIEAQCTGLPCLISDVINDDICLTENITKLSLRQSGKEWSQKIKAILSTFKRIDGSQTIIRQGYSTLQTIHYLEQVYMGKK